LNPKTTDLEAPVKNVGKACAHVSQNEGLIFEQSAPGKRGMELPPLDVPTIDPKKALGPEFTRDSIEGFPEVSEIEVIRHFTRLSTWNYAIDLGMYPLGSCTMKYNPRVNEFVARLDGLAPNIPSSPPRFRKAACASCTICRNACSPSPAWTRPHCSPPPARRANSPAC
jgi:glycine dehydrogenase subunit 2